MCFCDMQNTVYNDHMLVSNNYIQYTYVLETAIWVEVIGMLYIMFFFFVENANLKMGFYV
jgi:hypothetical protein